MTVTIGIDPGATGAIAVLNERGMIVEVHDMPYADGEVLAPVLADLLDSWGADQAATVWVEKVGAMPKQGIASTWKFAQGYGTILGAVSGCALRCRRVTPAVWKRNLGLSKDKGASRRLACELWPAQSAMFARVKDDGRAEAALIAEYGRRQELGA